jgi:tetratricopeptide (TPR) repeat protein
LKKSLPYIIAAVVVVLLIILLTASSRKREFDDRITFRRTDKIPYGTYVAYQSLQYLFPSSKISVNHAAPGSSPEINAFGQNQALIIVTPQFLPDQDEMTELIDFAKRGNEVFISAKRISQPAQELLRCEVMASYYGLPTSTGAFEDSLDVKLDFKPQIAEQDYFYPGYRFDSYFLRYDSMVGNQFGFAINNKEGTNRRLPDFMALKAGNGHIYLHLAPICFSNYFLLYHKNIDYYNKALSVIPENENKIVWDEYYLHKYYYSDSQNGKKSKNDILSGLMSHPAFRAAVWLIIIVLSLYVLQEIRRKQRYIMEVPRPRNDSMEFVKTIGRLYYEKADHKNLTKKMTAYFLEHVRNRYKLPTAQLDENFIMNLQMKSGQPENNIREIVSFIQQVEESPEISSKQLESFHKSLEDFYQSI